MNDYNKKRDFGARPSFGGGDRGGFQKRPLELFQATCAACGKTCEVPFRPNGKKPVYCKECFAKNGGPSADSRPDSRGGSDRFAPRRDFSRPPSSAYQPEHKAEGDRGMGEVARQMESMNAKLDKLIYLLTPKSAMASSSGLKDIETAPFEKDGFKEKKQKGKKFSLKKKK